MPNLSNLTLTIQIFKGGKKYVSYNPELDVSSCGNTPDSARNNLRDAVLGFVKSAYKLGTLNNILEEAGFIHRGKTWDTPEMVTLDRFSLVV